MDLYDIDLILQIDTGQTGDPAYAILAETCTGTILVGDSLTYTFTSSYIVPWAVRYYTGIKAWLQCDSMLLNDRNDIIECVNMTDLYMASIDDFSSSIDNVGSSIQVRAILKNRSDYETFPGLNITAVVTNSQGVETVKFTETTRAIGILATENHTFSNTYIVPNDQIYYLTVYIDSYDSYPHNDTMKIERKTNVGITPTGTTNVFTLAQNTPNPANIRTRIDYSIPEAGEVIFHIHSISGQILYSKTIEIERGAHSIELNTSAFAAGVYFYSMEYKRQRRVRQLIISN
jgi:hypothetical protein